MKEYRNFQILKICWGCYVIRLKEEGRNEVIQISRLKYGGCGRYEGVFYWNYRIVKGF